MKIWKVKYRIGKKGTVLTSTEEAFAFEPTENDVYEVGIELLKQYRADNFTASPTVEIEVRSDINV